MDFITVLYTVCAKAGSEKQLKAAMNSIVTPTRAEAGCISYELLEDEKDSRTFHTYEHWTSKEALATHLKSAHVQAMSKEATPLVEGDLTAGLKLLTVVRP